MCRRRLALLAILYHNTTIIVRAFPLVHKQEKNADDPTLRLLFIR